MQECKDATPDVQNGWIGCYNIKCIKANLQECKDAKLDVQNESIGRYKVSSGFFIFK